MLVSRFALVSAVMVAVSQLPAMVPVPAVALSVMVRLHTTLAIREPAEMTPDTLESLAWDIGGLYETLAKTYFG